MKNKLIEKLYYAACDMKELYNPTAEKKLSEVDEIIDSKMVILQELVPVALINDLEQACSEREELYGQTMFLLGLKSALMLLQGMDVSEEIEL